MKYYETLSATMAGRQEVFSFKPSKTSRKTQHLQEEGNINFHQKQVLTKKLFRVSSQSLQIFKIS